MSLNALDSAISYINWKEFQIKLNTLTKIMDKTMIVSKAVMVPMPS
jgi:hypothetical protein